MAATETIRIRIEPELKERLNAMYHARGTTVSQAVRTFLIKELESQADALARFDAIMASADSKAASAALPEPSIDDIVSYCSKVRDLRANDALCAS